MSPSGPPDSPLMPDSTHRWLAHFRDIQRGAERMVTAGAWVVGVGLAMTIALAVSSENPGALAAPGGVATFAGRLTGLVGTYLMLVALVLVARIPWLERSAGQERLTRWHRRLGGWPIALLVAHAVLITVGYASSSASGVAPMAWQLLTQYPNVLAAAVALALLITAGVSSWRVARRRIKRETWWTIHLYIYLAAALALAHQVTAGAAFVASPIARAWWLGMWAATAGTVLVFRFGLPLWRSLRHNLRVVDVRYETADTVSVTMRGRALDKLPVRGGQYLHWRFQRWGHIWHAHPYSLSAMPRDRHLRITVKASGDHSRDLGRLKVGTRVAVEGAYGKLNREAIKRDRLLLLAAGVGITPLRALLEDLPAGIHPVVVLRVSRQQDVIFHDELQKLVDIRGGRLEVLVGPRHLVRLNAEALQQLVPDVVRRDVFMCGPRGLVDTWRRSLLRAGVPKGHIHSESFDA